MRITSLMLCLVIAFGAAGEDARSVSKAAYDAYEAKDWPAFLENATKLDELRPNHPRVLYNLASAYALNGKKEAAIETLGRVASMGLVYRADRDDDFASIRDQAGFAAILKTFEKNGLEVGDASIAFKIDSIRGAVPEGIAHDHKTGDSWVGLVRDRAIWKVDSKGNAAKLDLPDDVWSVMGMVYDEESGTLWFCTAATSMMKQKDEAALGSSSVIAWNVAESKVTAKWVLPKDADAHWLGDLTLAPDGTIYTTDSLTPAIYRIKKGETEIERWLENDGFRSLQGLAWIDKARRLFVADYSTGIWSIDVESRESTLLPSPADATLLGIDGLYHYNGDLIAVQNGTSPHRILRLHLDPKATKIERVETLEANRPQFDEPTLGVVRDGWFWFVATSGWGSFTDDGVLKDGATEEPVVVMKRKL